MDLVYPAHRRTDVGVGFFCVFPQTCVCTPKEHPFCSLLGCIGTALLLLQQPANQALYSAVGACCLFSLYGGPSGSPFAVQTCMHA
jgi:hypothetical protein